MSAHTGEIFVRHGCNRNYDQDIRPPNPRGSSRGLCASMYNSNRCGTCTGDVKYTYKLVDVEVIDDRAET